MDVHTALEDCLCWGWEGTTGPQHWAERPSSSSPFPFLAHLQPVSPSHASLLISRCLKSPGLISLRAQNPRLGPLLPQRACPREPDAESSKNPSSPFLDSYSQILSLHSCLSLQDKQFKLPTPTYHSVMSNSRDCRPPGSCVHGIFQA